MAFWEKTEISDSFLPKAKINFLWQYLSQLIFIEFIAPVKIFWGFFNQDRRPFVLVVLEKTQGGNILLETFGLRKVFEDYFFHILRTVILRSAQINERS